jgi:hypothetical protein
MTALLDSAALDQADDTGTTLARLVRAEFMKLRTTDTGWLFLAGFIVFTMLALTINGFGTHNQLYPQKGLDGSQALAEAARSRTPAGVAAIAASMMSSGHRGHRRSGHAAVPVHPAHQHVTNRMDRGPFGTAELARVRRLGSLRARSWRGAAQSHERWTAR